MPASVSPSVETPRPNGKVCTHCKQFLPLEKFNRERKDREKRRSICTDCRVQKDLHRRTKTACSEFRTFLREVRKSRPGRIEALVASMVDRLGGENAFTNRWLELFKNGSDSFRLQTYSTILAISRAVEQQKVTEAELLLQEVKAGILSENRTSEALTQFGEDQLIDAACEPVRVLVQMDLLPEVLKRLTERGELTRDQSECLRRAVR